MKALLILAWRDDVGAYVLHSYPERFAEQVDGQDLMNIYNSHRFRTTDKNFKILKRGDFNAASFYSGGYHSAYIAKPNYCVTLVLEESDNPNAYEKVLIKVTNNLLSKLDADDFDYILEDTYYKLKEKRFDEIEVMRGEIEFDEVPTPTKKLATTSSASLSDEEQIFEDLMSSSEFMPADEKESKLADFEESGLSDPFSASEPSNDPFGGGANSGTGAGQTESRDLFAENPFGDASSSTDPFADDQKPSISSSLPGADETLGKRMFKEKKTSANEIIAQLDSLEEEKPPKPNKTDQDAQFKYLENLVSFLQEKVNILGKLVNGVKELEKSNEEKDKLIGKLLLLLEEKK
ncbi:MAG: hypothetical protein ACOC35_04290 [Promethearchaeia archaeon]